MPRRRRQSNGRRRGRSPADRIAGSAARRRRESVLIGARHRCVGRPARLAEEALTDELALLDAAGASEEAAARMGRVLVERIELRHLVEDLDEAFARVALVGEEEEPGIELDRLAPRRPALGSEVAAVVIGIAAAE